MKLKSNGVGQLIALRRITIEASSPSGWRRREFVALCCVPRPEAKNLSAERKRNLIVFGRADFERT